MPLIRTYLGYRDMIIFLSHTHIFLSLTQGYDAGDAEEEDMAPTFEDLAIDESLSDLQRVKKYVYSNIALQRLVRSPITDVHQNAGM